MRNIIEELEWQGNSKKMYKTILNQVPSIFRGRINNAIISWITRNNISVVTEELVFKAVDDIAPKNMAENRIKPELIKLKSK